MKSLSTCLFLCLFILPLFGQKKQNQDIDSQIIVKLEDNIDISNLLTTAHQNDLSLKHLKKLGIHQNIHLLKIESSILDKNMVLQNLSNYRNVIAVQSNYLLDYRDTEPDDYFYPEQWDMEKIGMPAVWDLSTGGLTANGDTIVIAILDSAFDIEHPDLKDNIWHNYAEIPNDGIDNDENGYVDDYVGWNFRHNTLVHALDRVHGQKVAGIAGAKGNNQIGIAGVNWTIKLLLLDTREIEHVIPAYEYIIDLRRRYNESGGTDGAFIVASNASWGQSQSVSCDSFPIASELFNQMGEVGILTIGATVNASINVDVLGDFPTGCASEYLITVTNTDEGDEKAGGAGYGKTTIDMGVPGSFSNTITFHDGYGTIGGTSAAAPHATGAIGLLYSLACADIAADALIHPAETAALFKKVLLEGVDPIANLKNYTLTGGRLNVYNSTLLLTKECNVNIGELDILKIYPNPVTDKVLTIAYQAPDFEEYAISIHNALGQLLFSDTVIPNLFSKKLYKIEVANFPAGLYTFSLQRNNNRVVEKFLVVR